VSIEFISICYNFQRRLVWFLSSLLQQSLLPDVTVNLAYIKNNGSPRTEDIISFYRSQGIKFRTLILEDVEDLAYRGKIRNAQISLSRAEWLFFFDIDQILHPDFFRKWVPALSGDFLYCETQKLFTPGTRQCLAMNAQGKRRYIRKAYQKASAWAEPQDYDRPSGGLMMVSRKLLYSKTGGLYSPSLDPKDRHFSKHITGSDPIFRKHFTLKRLSLAPVIHLDHKTSDVVSTEDIQL